MTIKVLVADDQELIRSALETVIDLQDDMEVVASVADGDEAITQALARRVDVALLDIRMGATDGITASSRIRRHRGGVRTLILTTYDEDDYLFRSLAAGAAGFLTKDTPATEIVAAIRQVHAGRSVVSPRATRALVDEVAARVPLGPGGDPLERHGLTAREREVLALLARGFSNAEIAGVLYVAESTVKTHVGSLIRKLGVRDRLHIVVWAYQHGAV
ncbi:response regulator transcription factor [Nocardioides jensenii]|uniref:response regulator transcription factor n=1 Tax=Nocardioides jensenii TaxID=1843 RepID=UPI0008309184|nr:response regulator transcription factor [Nocardioides jensenii]